MEKIQYKAILLILACDTDPLYKFFRRVYMQYLDKHPQVKVFFVYGSGTTFERQSHDLVYDDVKESLICPWATTKVIRAMEHIDEHYDYDYLVRTNMSTFWDLERLVARLDQYPKTQCLTGFEGIFKTHITGIAMVLSRDIVKQIVANQSTINVTYHKNFSEDYLFSTFVTNNDHAKYVVGNEYTKRIEKYTTYGHDQMLNIIQTARKGLVDNFRIKSFSHDPLKTGRRLQMDAQIMTALLKVVYNIDYKDPFVDPQLTSTSQPQE